MKNKFLAILALIFVFILFLCVQISLFKFLFNISVTPNMLLIFVVLLGFLNNKRTGIVAGIIAGILLDIFSGTYLGLYTLVYIYIGYFSAKLNRYFVKDNLTIVIVITALADLFYSSVIYIFSFLVRQRYEILSYIVSVILPEIIITILISIILYKPILYLNKRLNLNKLFS